MTPRALAAFGRFLADSDFKWNDLREAFASMLNALTQHAGSEKKARRMLLDSVPADKQKRLAVLLGEIEPTKRGRGRPAGAKGETAYAKSYALYDFYCRGKAQGQKREQIIESLAEAKYGEVTADADPFEATEKALKDAIKRLRPSDRKTIETVNEICAGRKVWSAEGGKRHSRAR